MLETIQRRLTGAEQSSAAAINITSFKEKNKIKRTSQSLPELKTLCDV